MNDYAIIRIARIRGTASPRLLRTLAGFGLGVQERTPPTRPPLDRRTVAAIVRTLLRAPQGKIVLLQGESGCGKSTHLRAMHSALLEASASCRMIDLGRWTRSAEQARTLIDQMPGPRGDALGLLSAMGLGDALVMAQDPDTLSEGQSARLRIARAVARLIATRTSAPRVLLIDEFASVLDRASARTLCHTMARLVRRSRSHARDQPLSLVLATAHEDVADWLDPDMIVQLRSAWDLGPQTTASIHRSRHRSLHDLGSAA